MSAATLLHPKQSDLLVAPLWRDRHDAGVRLADFMASSNGPWQNGFARRERFVRPPIVLALPRGGVTVAQPIAQRLDCALATWSVRKVTMAEDPEYAIGALALGPTVVWSDSAAELVHLSPAQRDHLVAVQQAELERRRNCYVDPPPEDLLHRTVVVVDDGAATGLTAQAALDSLRRLGIRSLVFAVPVIDRGVALRLQNHCDLVVALAVVDDLIAVGRWYSHFDQLTDDEVLHCLGRSAASKSQLSRECSDAV
jgi:putative phosphoribosyl transferase